MIKIYKIDTLTNIISINANKYNCKDIAMIAYICWKLNSKPCLAQNKDLIVKGYTNILINDSKVKGFNFSYLVLENPIGSYSINDVFHIGSSTKRFYYLYNAIQLAIDNKKGIYNINSYPTIMELVNFAIGFIKDNYGRDYNEYLYRFVSVIKEIRNKAVKGKDVSSIDSYIFNFDDTAFRYDLIEKGRE